MDYIPLLLVAAFFLLVWDAPRHQIKTRRMVCLIPALLCLQYLSWRLFSTVWPDNEDSAWAQTWIWGVWGIEVLAFIEVAVFLLIMSRTNTRSEEANQHQMPSPLPEVDIFIPTYNEPLDVLEKTIVAAAAVDYPHKTVWVLDDGKRDWLRTFCEETGGVRYLTRADNTHAKAGNMNHALTHAKGQFIAVFDADFVPSKNFIRRTLGFFSDPAIGIVQTPQHFYNKDPIQTNLGLMQIYPDEQRLFFDQMAASRDAWQAAFCCGSCSIMRRQAVDAVGGIPTQSITEDLLTTLVMLRKGYQTIYLNERLSMGLAAESIEGFFVQRERWCRGAIQSLFLKAGPLGPGLSVVQRILFFPTSWLTQYAVRLMLIAIPLAYLLLGWLPFHFTDAADMVFYQLPVFLSFFLAMRWLVGGHFSPLVSGPAGVFASFRLAPTVVASLIKPFGKPFRVTPKGSDAANGARVEFFSLGMILLCMGLTLLGLLLNVVPELAVVPHDEFFPIAMFWSMLNVVTLGLAALLCFEGPRLRKEERFLMAESAIAHDGETQVAVNIIDASVDGCKLALPSTGHGLFQKGTASLTVAGVGRVKIHPVRQNATHLAATFEYDSKAQRNAMICKLFSGEHTTVAPASSSTRQLMSSLWEKTFHG
ncbi:Curdlan synthase [Limnohabitans sp. MMS-10A-160]|uniref:glycosyltransferase family 2 protein n=1 Tax=unclassified Limnohabitans TaxID=2626134 RepID=UPI000D3C1B28|nr:MULTISPECIES: cellulose synthase catalytic subunit [unclassified Limnohabitans]PUE19138.1 Curdlan synthase [Limnohabitans sp. MMS-10A-192]PUE24256.1 Curdlan synthase [Limnohabitans sp. MMS-10A-160]